MNSGTCWAFLVVSDPQQSETLVDQKAWAHDLARERGWTVTRTISGVSSGRDGARKLTLDMIAELEAMSTAERPARILVIRLDRLGRGDGLEAMNAFLQLRRLGVVVHTRLDGDVSGERASELLMPVLRFFIGGMENEVRRDKLLNVYQRRRKRRESNASVAISARTPYGLVYQAGYLEPQQPQASVVRFIFELKCLGYGHHIIAKRLRNIAPPMTCKTGRVQFRRFTSDSVRGIIINPRYAGTIIDEAVWQQAQAPVGRYRPPKQRFDYPLGGALRCHCGTPLVGVRGSGLRSSRHRYYQCRNSEAHEGRFRHYRSDVLEGQFVELLRTLVADDSLISSYVRAQGLDERGLGLSVQLAGRRGQVSRFEDRRRTVFAAFEDQIIGASDLRQRLGELEIEEKTLMRGITELERELGEIQQQRVQLDSIHSAVTSAHAAWLVAPINERRALAKAVCAAFGGCTVTTDGQLALSAWTPPAELAASHHG